MVIRWEGHETETPMDSWGRARAFEALMDYSRLEYRSFDKLGQDHAALCYSFRLVDTIRFLSVLQHGVGITEQVPERSGQGHNLAT